MREKPEGLLLGPARLLILGLLASLAGCLLALFLSASPASAAEPPHADPNAPGSLTATVSLVEQHVATATDTIMTSDLRGDRLALVVAPLTKAADTVAATATKLTANVTELISSLPLSDPVAVELPESQMAIADAPEQALAEGRLASFAAASAASITADPVTAAEVSPSLPLKGDPVTPPPASISASSSSAGTSGGAAAATAGENAWAPTLISGVSSTQNDPLPSSSNDGSDPAPD